MTMLESASNMFTEIESSNKTILFWTDFFDIADWYVKDIFEEDYLMSTGCRWTNCIATSNRSQPRHPEDFDAVIFHATEPSWAVANIPMKRSPHQVYIMATLE